VIPSGTPRPIVQKIQSDTARVLANPEVKKRIEDLGMEVIASRPEQFDDFIQSEIRKWKRVIADAKIELE
jgi:tripartite-type tricarboxylate transporter receptor subunit TctC